MKVFSFYPVDMGQLILKSDNVQSPLHTWHNINLITQLELMITCISQLALQVEAPHKAQGRRIHHSIPINKQTQARHILNSNFISFHSSIMEKLSIGYHWWIFFFAGSHLLKSPIKVLNLKAPPDLIDPNKPICIKNVL